MKVKLINEDIRTDYVRNLLSARGIADIEKFLNPTIDCLQDFSNLDFIQEGVNIIREWTKSDWKLLLVVDSDADGYCSSAILYQYLKKLCPEKEIDFICHEAKQHGLEDIVNRVDLMNYDLVILPDAGTNDDQYVEEYPATQFLMLDHHDRTEPIGKRPSNMCIVNNQISDKYENKSLCGAGVTWQFCRALDNEFEKDWANEFIDLAAFAIIADVMNVTTLENRYIISEGLNNINNYFLNLLLQKQSFSLGNGPLTPTGVAFYIIPLINSMCRVGTLEEKERMFLAFVDGHRKVICNKRGAKGTMEEIAIESVRECTNTKAKQARTQEKMTELAEMQIINDNLLENKVLIITLNELFDDIPSEINGLTATKLSNKYRKPTLIGRVNSQGEMKGSIRGLATLDMPPLKEFLMSSGLFEFVEGHALAAGFGIKEKKLDNFHSWANEQLADINMDEGVFNINFKRSGIDEDIPNIIYDMDNIKFSWGQGNPEPLIYIHDLNITDKDIAIIGKGDTVKIVKNNVVYMFFKQSPEQVEKLTQYKEAKLNIVGTMNINNYLGMTTPQIFVKEYEIEDSQFLF